MSFGPQGSGHSPTYRSVVIFVDGHSFRYALSRILPGFDAERTPLPVSAKWLGFFRDMASYAEQMYFKHALLRTYWYVPDSMTPCNEERRPEAQVKARRVKIAEEQEAWRTNHEEVARRAGSLEFVYAGTRKYKFDKEPENAWAGEKGVDVAMAVDMLRKAPIYDVAIVVTRDADFVPAIRAVKDLGKVVVVPRFTDAEGKLVVEAADQLLLAADRTLNIEGDYLRRLLAPGKPTPAQQAGPECP